MMAQSYPAGPSADDRLGYDGAAESRGAPRRRLLKQVQVLALDKKSTSAVDGTLRNLSRTGAMLSGPGPSISRIPGQFYISWPGRLRMTRCKVVWKTYEEMGIRFVSDPGPAVTAMAEAASKADRKSKGGSFPDPGQKRGVVKAHATSPLAAILRKLDQDCDGLGPQPRLVDIDRLVPGANAVRRALDAADLDALAQSIRDKGLLQPLIVRPHSYDGCYEIVAGERRWQAARLARLREVPVLIREVGDREALEIALIENMQRSDLNGLDEARGYEQLVARFGYTHKRVAEAVGKSRSHVTNTVRLLTLPDEVKRHIEAGSLTAGHARALVAAKRPIELAERIVAQNLSVRHAEQSAKAGRGSGTAATSSGHGDGEHDELARQMAVALGLRVEIAAKRRGGGRLTVHFQSTEQLQEVCRRLCGEADRNLG